LRVASGRRQTFTVATMKRSAGPRDPRARIPLLEPGKRRPRPRLCLPRQARPRHRRRARRDRPRQRPCFLHAPAGRSRPRLAAAFR